MDVVGVGPQRFRKTPDNLGDGHTALDFVELIRWERRRYERKAEASIVDMPL